MLYMPFKNVESVDNNLKMGYKYIIGGYYNAKMGGK
jgi:hypothetical protein